jgi:hypothetical protein
MAHTADFGQRPKHGCWRRLCRRQRVDLVVELPLDGCRVALAERHEFLASGDQPRHALAQKRHCHQVCIDAKPAAGESEIARVVHASAAAFRRNEERGAMFILFEICDQM